MDYIIISDVDWTTHGQIHQQLATSLAEHGHRALFVENIEMRFSRFKDIWRIVDRVRNGFSSVFGFREIRPNLCLYSPVVLPFSYSLLALKINSFLIYSPLKRWLSAVRYARPIIISFLPTPLIQRIVERIEPELTVYYCVDDMVQAKGSVERFMSWDNAFFSQADIVLASSEAIADRARKHSSHVYVFPEGVGIHKFNPDSELSRQFPEGVVSLPRPIIGYIGDISTVLDKELIVSLAKAFPDATVLLVGPKNTDMSFIAGAANIVWLDRRSHEMMPAYISCFDVALIPYVVNDYADSVYSCKLNEYLAMGVTVVSTNLREVQAFGEANPDAFFVGKDNADFIAYVRQVLSGPYARSRNASERRTAIAREDTWEQRFAGIMGLIAEHRAMKAASEADWAVSLSTQYRRIRSKLLKRAGMVLVMFLLVFHTPLVWFIGDQLVIRDPVLNADAIVVFSGVGDTSYRNDSYQRRALEAVRFYKKGYAPSLYISSGARQNISEVEIIRLYLLDNGVPASALHLLDEYPVSTYGNVRMVARDLRKNGARSIIFLTSPYHARRAYMLWRTQAPGISVTVPPVMDTPPARPQWGASMAQIRTIVYEYAAIAYNWYKGRL